MCCNSRRDDDLSRPIAPPLRKCRCFYAQTIGYFTRFGRCALEGYASRADCRQVGVDRLPSRRVATSVCVLCLRCWRAGSTDGFPGSFGGLLTRLLKVSIISPQVGSILATVHEDAAGPSRPYTCDDVSNLTLKKMMVPVRTTRVRVVLELRLCDLVCSAIIWNP